MEEKVNGIGSGQEYPILKIGEQTYTVKFTRGMLYRMNKASIQFLPTFAPGGQAATLQLGQLIDTLHMAINFQGTHEDLAELVFDRRDEVAVLLIDAWGKVILPSLQARIPQTAEKKSGEQVQ